MNRVSFAHIEFRRYCIRRTSWSLVHTVNETSPKSTNHIYPKTIATLQPNAAAIGRGPRRRAEPNSGHRPTNWVRGTDTRSPQRHVSHSRRASSHAKTRTPCARLPTRLPLPARCERRPPLPSCIPQLQLSSSPALGSSHHDNAPARRSSARHGRPGAAAGRQGLGQVPGPARRAATA